MKRNLLKAIVVFIICIALVNPAGAQCTSCWSYQFTHTTGTYSNLSSATQLGTATSFTTDAIPLGFRFYHYSVPYDTIDNDYNGFASLVSSLHTYQSDLYPMLAFCDPDTNYTDCGIRYKTSGTAGSRVFVLEWRDVAIGHIGSALNDDHVNFQLALYEGTNVIEFRYGPGVITDANGDFSGVAGPQVWQQIQNFSPLMFRGILLSGNPSSPTTAVDIPSSDNLDGVPANGTIYRFTPTITGISEMSQQISLSLYPNPANNNVTISIDETLLGSTATITDITGRKMAAVKLSTVNRQLSTANFANGVYFVTVTQSDGRSITKKLNISK